MKRSLDVNRVLSAAEHIDPIFLDTPLIRRSTLDEMLGCELFLKIESLNPLRSFKGRGAELFAATELSAGATLVTASAGNFGQAMAYAAGRRGCACTVFAARNANPMKVAAMQRLGADVRLFGDDFDAAKIEATRYASEIGARFVEDGAEPAIAEGAGTIAVELVRRVQPDIVVVPLGNGALLSGVGATLRRLAPGARIVAAAAAGAPSMELSLAAGRSIETESVDTIADGVAVRVPVPEALEMLQGCYDEVVGVADVHIIRAISLAVDHLGLAIEPAGAVGLAAILADPDAYAGRKVATIITGGNVTFEALASWREEAKRAAPERLVTLC
jgi:threonine dehydratase